MVEIAMVTMLHSLGLNLFLNISKETIRLKVYLGSQSTNCARNKSKQPILLTIVLIILN